MAPATAAAEGAAEAKAEAEAEAERRRWRLYARNQLRAAPFNAGVAALLVAIVWGTAPQGLALAWLAALLAVVAVRIPFCRAALRQDRCAEPRFRHGTVMLMAAAGLVWAAMPFAFALLPGSIELTSSTIVGSAVVAGSAVSCALYRPALAAFAVPAMSGQLLFYLQEPRMEHVWMAGVMLLVFLFVWMMAQQFGGEIRGRLRSEADLEESHRRIAAQAEELRLLADSHRAEAERATAASEAKSRFLANMSHEIRTPLNGVLGMAAALSQTALGEAQRRMVEVIAQAGSGLLHIIDDILDLSRIEAGKMSLDPRPFDLEVLMRALEGGNADEARRKGLRLSVDCPPEARGRFVADANRLRQVLQNLVANALKFTRSGDVVVRVRCAPRTPDAANAPDTANGPDTAAGGRQVALRFEVEDTGIGIPPEKLEAVFQPFEQADAGTTRRFGGSGLGLSICRQLVTMMGGRISAQSRPGAGSLFSFEIPAEISPAVEAESEPGVAPERLVVPLPGGGERPMRILAAEDSLTNRLVLQALLAPTGASIAVAEDGRQVLAACEREAFDLILMDVHMPVLDGEDATRELRRREAARGRARTPVVALTANVMAHQVEDYRAAGMDACIGKPIDRGRLIAAIAAAVDGAAFASRRGSAGNAEGTG